MFIKNTIGHLYVIYIREIISGEHFIVVWSETSYLLQQYHQ